MPTAQFIRVPVQFVSLDVPSQDGEGPLIEVGDDGKASLEAYGYQDKDNLLSCLTKRQRQVAELMGKGYDRQEIGEELHVVTQAVHQIILRIRRRLYERAGIPISGWKRRHGSY